MVTILSVLSSWRDDCWCGLLYRDHPVDITSFDVSSIWMYDYGYFCDYVSRTIASEIYRKRNQWFRLLSSSALRTHPCRHS